MAGIERFVNYWASKFNCNSNDSNEEEDTDLQDTYVNFIQKDETHGAIFLGYQKEVYGFFNFKGNKENV